MGKSTSGRSELFITLPRVMPRTPNRLLHYIEGKFREVTPKRLAAQGTGQIEEQAALTDHQDGVSQLAKWARQLHVTPDIVRGQLARVRLHLDPDNFTAADHTDAVESFVIDMFGDNSEKKPRRIRVTSKRHRNKRS